MKKKLFQIPIWMHGMMLLASILFVALFSTSTSPFYATFGSDSAIFQVIGKDWAEGMIPYTQLFDHKGPWIFFVDALGYRLGCGTLGLCIVQVLFLVVTLVGVYKIASLHFEENPAFIWTMITLGFLTVCYEGGNLTEEYVLPFLAFSTWLQLRWLRSAESEHNPVWAFFYGITFSICVLTRLTNAIGLCTGILVILIVLIKDKKWACIGKNILGVVAGIVVSALPFVIYFAAHGALWDMFYASILQNIKAAEGVTNFWWTNPHSVVGWIHIVTAHFCSIFMVVAGVLAVMKKEYKNALFYLVTGVSMLLYLVTRYAFYHYMMIAMMWLPVVVAECGRLLAGKEASEIRKNRIYNCFAAFLLVLILYQSFILYRDFIHVPDPQAPAYEELLMQVPGEDMDAFVAYNVKADMYLIYDIKPCYRYFHHQDAQASKNADLRRLVEQEYASNRAKWILYMENEENDNCIADILSNSYDVVDNKDEYTLYKLK